MAVDNQKLVSVFAELRPSSTFLGIKGYRNNHGEVSNFGIIFHVSYERILQKSLVIAEAFKTTNDLEVQAKVEVIQSFKNSIERFAAEPIEQREDAFVHFQDADGRFIKGVKSHKQTNELYLYGYLHHKEVVVPGTYKVVKNKELTVAKKRITSLTPADKWRQFSLSPNRFEDINVQGLNLHSDPVLESIIVT